MGKVHNKECFGFCAFPVAPGATGRFYYIINEDSSVLLKRIDSTPRPKNWPTVAELMYGGWGKE